MRIGTEFSLSNIMGDAIDKHVLAMDVYIALMAKRLTLVATESERGTVYEFSAEPTINQSQCLVGMYTNDQYTPQRKGKKFYIYLTKKQLTNSLDDLYAEFTKKMAL